MDDLIASFEVDLELRGMAPSTRKTYISMVQQFSNHLASRGKNLLGIGKPELKDWLRHLRMERHLKAASLEYYFTALSSFYDYLLDEELIESNLVPAFRKRNLRAYKKSKEAKQRKLISVEEAAQLVRSIVDSRDRAIVVLLLKTGIRRHELADLDVQDVDLQNMALRLKETPKRSNRTVFFDGEALEALNWWLESRGKMDCRDTALFVGTGGVRLKPNSINRIVMRYATRVGLHIPGSDRPEDHFTAHCCRHWQNTYLLRAGMKREHVQFIRGDAIKQAIDVYYHIDPEEVRESYLAHIPHLGI